MSGRSVRRLLSVGLVSMLVAAAAAAGVMWGERRATRRAISQGGESAPLRRQEANAPTRPAASEPVEVVITPEARERAGIKTTAVRNEAAVSVITVPGTVTSNAYRDTRIHSLVAGVVRLVPVELGAAVERGQALAVISSPELADAQMKYLSMRAMLQADHQKRVRTEKLAEIGAASRQELEEVAAVHDAHETEVAAARQRLLVLGLTAARVDGLQQASQVVSDVTVAAPARGLVIARQVNPGQVVSAGQELFVVTDLATVWVIGDLYEKDFAAVGVGAEALVALPTRAERRLQGRVSYIDPRVDPTTRTAKARVEVPNRSGELRLGMFVTVEFRAATAERQILVPRAALQTIGERTVVYVPVEGDDTRYIERSVKVGAGGGEAVQVLEGLRPGENVVSQGSFFLRAEAARTRPGG